ADEGRRVCLVVRANTLAAGMARYLRDRIERSPGIEILLEHTVRELAGEHRLAAVVVRNIPTGESRTIAAGGMVILIGAVPMTDWLSDDIARDAEGFVKTGPQLRPDMHSQRPWSDLRREPYLVETSRPGVFAVGDVRSGSTKMV